MKSVLQSGINLVLAHPMVFEWQQRTCNSYGNIKDQYSSLLNSGRKRILDIGCSTGAAAANIIDMSVHDYTGIDIDPKYVEFAQKRHPNVKFLTMDAKDMAFEDEAFDICMFNGVLHHIDDETAKSILKDVHRVLKKDGSVIVSEPVFTDGKWFSSFLLKLDRGRFIRNVEGYKSLFPDFTIVEEGFVPFSVHRLCTFVLKKTEDQKQSQKLR